MLPINAKATPIFIDQAFEKITFLAHRRPKINISNHGFCSLAEYRDGGIVLAHYAGNSEWERHISGDEIVMIMEGETRLILLQNGEEVVSFMPQGTLLVVPQNRWHRFESPKGVKLMAITPQPTDYSVEKNQLAKLANNCLAA